ncbi:MAG: ABC transporter substrate-binding protein [Methanoregula sp.]|nr:ABC transporter substrate-binding protein [Methanoregula sp.]MDD5023728.1 ABC transporter substrate-binding protein [Methanoregula sp.]MDD5187680.1 ABC transporter substrate-binding protein [Methanoregula sp.]
MQKTWNIILVLVVVVAVTGFLIAVFLYPETPFSGAPESVTLGVSPFQTSTLIWIAEDQGYFAANGLNVTIRSYDAGLYAVNALIAGDVDIATASEFVFVKKILSGQNLSAVGCIAKTEDEYIVARKDRGIVTVTDLKGKKIGTSKGTNAEFYLGRFLSLNGISPANVTIVDRTPPQLVDAITTGDLDAVTVWEPYSYTAEKNLGASAVSFPAQAGQSYYWLLVTRPDYGKAHPEVITRLLHSFVQAETFVERHPEKAQEIVRNRLHYDPEYTATIWTESQFALSLDQSLVIAMEDESRWLMNNNITPKSAMPVFLDYLNRQGLDTVKPESATIIR